MIREGDDFRLASSLDEVAAARSIAVTAATKLGRQPQAVLAEQFERVRQALLEHDGAVRAIAGALMREHTLRGAKLAHLLPFAGIEPRQPASTNRELLA